MTRNVEKRLLRHMCNRLLKSLERGKEESAQCLEASDDVIFTPCAHRMRRESILATWPNATSGLCPVCRKTISKQELITAPNDSRFRVDIKKNWVESSKVAALMRELERLRSSGTKSILFTSGLHSWTS